MATKRTVLALTIASLVTVLVSGMLARSAAVAATQAPPGLEGSWFVTDPNRPGAFAALSTFTADGAAFAQGPSPRFSPAHGRWMKTGDREFTATVIHLVSEGGQYLGTRKHGGIITLSETGDAYVADWLTEDFDREGNLTESHAEVRHGARMSVEPRR